MTIPKNLRQEFMAHMEAHDVDDLPDGAWFQCLEDAADGFIKEKRLKNVHSNDAVHDYLRMLRQ